MVAPDDEHVAWLIRTADKPASTLPEAAVKQAPRRDNNYLGAAASMTLSTPKPKPGSQLVAPTLLQTLLGPCTDHLGCPTVGVRRHV